METTLQKKQFQKHPTSSREVKECRQDFPSKTSIPKAHTSDTLVRSAFFNDFFSPPNFKLDNSQAINMIDAINIAPMSLEVEQEISFEDRAKNLVSNLTSRVSGFVNSILRNTNFSSPTEILIEQQEFVVDGVTYRMRIERVSEQEILQRIVLDWIDNLETRKNAKTPFPPKFKDCLESLNKREFIEKYYGNYLDVGALYRDQLSKIDPELMNNIIYHYDNKDELFEKIPTISSRIDKTVQALKKAGIDENKLKNFRSFTMREG